MEDYPRVTTTSYRLPKELEPEQEIVLNLITEPWSQREFVIVQGVAGSGKTTIALHALKHLAESYRRLLDDKQVTPTLVTYNEYLVRFCRQVLGEFDTVAAYLAEPGLPQSGKINILTFRELCSFLIDDETKSNLLSDNECINIVAEISARRGIIELLPSQIYALITAFLKGRPDFRNLTYSELEERLALESIFYNIYRQTLLMVKRFVEGEYDTHIGHSYDRADLSLQILQNLQENEARLDLMKQISAEDLRRSTRRTLGDNDRKYTDLVAWLKRFFADLERFATLEREVKEFLSILSGRNINEPTWRSIQDRVVALARKFGLRGTKAFQTLGQHVVHPLIIVDETQDLSQVECNILISLWFHLQRKDPHSRLVFLGDLNQQMMPTGFRWEEVIDLIRVQCQRYGYGLERFNPNLGFVEEEHNRTTPFRKLMNNYRTTEEVARFAYEMMESVARQNLSGRALRYCLKNVIHPERTLPIQISDVYNGTASEDRIPRIIVVEQDHFINGLKKYLSRLDLEKQTDEDGRVIVIAADDSRITEMVKEDATLLSRFTYYPLLSCKGLEFMGCAIFGLPTKGGERLELDILGQWYTVCTRPRLREILFVDQEQLDYLKKSGWQEIPPDTALIIDAAEVSDKDPDEFVAESLARISIAHLYPEAMRVAGEAYLLRFINTVNEAFLLESITYYESGDWHEEANNARRQGAQVFERHAQYDRAVRWYLEIGESLAVVRCAKLRIDQLRESEEDIANFEIERLTMLAGKQIQQLESQGDFSLAAAGWEILEEFDKATSSAIRAEELDRAERNVEKVSEEDKKLELLKQIISSYIGLARVTVIPMFIDSEKLKRAEQLVERLPDAERSSFFQRIARQYLQGSEEQWPNAYRVLYYAEDSKGAQNLANQWERTRKYRALAEGYIMTKDNEQLNLLGDRLKRSIEFEAAAHCFERLENIHEAADCWMKAYYHWSDRAHGLLGIRIEDSPTRWFMIGFRNWVDHVWNQRSCYKVTQETLELIFRLIPRTGRIERLNSEQAEMLVRNTTVVRDQLLKSREWKRALRKFVEDLEGRVQECRLYEQNTTIRLRWAKDALEMELDPMRLENLQQWILDDIIGQFQSRAESTVEGVLTTDVPDREVKAAVGWYKICGNKQRALDYIDRLWNRRREELMLVAVKCWRDTGEQNKARERIDALSLPKYANLVFTAYDSLYSDDQSARDSARNQLRRRLEQEESNVARKILADLFPILPVTRETTPEFSGVQTLVRSIVQLRNAINSRAFEDENDRAKVWRDLEYITKKIEMDELQEAEEQWKITRQIVLDSREDLEEQIRTVDEHWEDVE